MEELPKRSYTTIDERTATLLHKRKDLRAIIQALGVYEDQAPTDRQYCPGPYVVSMGEVLHGSLVFDAFGYARRAELVEERMGSGSRSDEYRLTPKGRLCWDWVREFNAIEARKAGGGPPQLPSASGRPGLDGVERDGHGKPD